MSMVEEMILSGFISKAINEIVDIPENLIKKAIKDADKKRRDKNQSIETRIYQVTIDSINKFTNDMYKDQDDLYDATESMIRGFIRHKNDRAEAVRVGLNMLVSQVTSETCEDFLKTLHHEICIDKNDALYKEITLIQGEQTVEAVREGFAMSNKNDEETHKKLDHVIEGIDNITEKISETENDEKKHYEVPVKNRAEEYAKKWDKNVFLNDFNKRDKNASVNIKLKELYLEEHLPHYVWKLNDEPLDDLKELLCEYTVDNDDKKMLLILGQAGIGKSTLITWIMANLVEKKNVLIYQFANDLDSIEWQDKNILKEILSDIGLRTDELEGKTLILDGFDEVYISSGRERVLNKLNQDLKKLNTLRSFSVIITCRENYVYNLQNIDCDYIVLQAWDETQIENFCRTYWEKCGNDISEDIIQKILENKEIFGIPLILYMILASDITIEKSSSIVNVYDQIFSLERGAIYDRRYDLEHRLNDPKIKEHIYRISQKMAFWIFENNADKAFISQEKFEEICDNEMNEYGKNGEYIQSETLIGNFFKLRHFEGKGTDELQFVHRSIYEYFVVIYFFESIYNLTSKEEVAGKLGELLKVGRLSEQILEFIKYKFDSMEGFNLPKFAKDIFNIMLRDGMTYYTKERYKNIIERERNVFLNMLEIVGIWNLALGEINDRIIIYLQCNIEEGLNLEGIKLGVKISEIKSVYEAYLNGADLNGTYLRGANLKDADLIGVYLSGADLRGANLVRADLGRAHLSRADLREVDLSGAVLDIADLREANMREVNLKNASLVGAYLTETDLRESNLSGADLIGANLEGANLSGANLMGTIFGEGQANMLHEKYDLNGSRIVLSEKNEEIDYQEYYIKKQKG